MRRAPPRRAQRLGALALGVALLAAGCAPIHERRGLRVQALEAPRQAAEPRGKGYRLKGGREGGVVRLRVVEVERCVDVRLQRAEGFERVERQPRGPGLKMQWVMGGLFSVAAAAIAGWHLSHPPTPASAGTLQVSGARTVWLQVAVFGGVGGGLLIGSAVQTAGLGVRERPLGVRELRHEGPLRTCSARPARAGRVRLTLGDGGSLEADVDGEGNATISLPDDIEARLQRGGRRGTVEVLGDWRSQARIAL